MCGICGNLNLSRNHRIDIELLKRMVLAMRHRGPEENGLYSDDDIGLGHARLRIIDLEGGRQPIHNEDKSIWIVFNGEIFNYIELRESLSRKGHKFYTKTDTEVLVHLYEEKGVDFLNDLNGQFAFAIWDKKKKQLMLARDRVGIRPLFYTIVDGSLLFGSEVKTLFMDKRVERAIDPKGLDQLFTFWSTLPPQTVFKNIQELAPGHYLLAKGGKIIVQQYWEFDFSSDYTYSERKEDIIVEEFVDLLKDAIRLRLRSDVPVAAYLSGGIDSSFIAALVKKCFNNKLETFSVAFQDVDYDESSFQKQMSRFLVTEHKEIRCGYEDIGRIMSEIVWHAEKPLIRTAPAPLFLLSKLVRDNNIKVVLTGEGADEMLAGYDLFREMKIRRFWARNPSSKMRPLLFSKLYQSLPNWPRKATRFLESFYRANLLEVDSLYYSHIPKWKTTESIKNFFSQDINKELQGSKGMDMILGDIPERFSSWDYLSKAQYIEIKTLLSGNLLSSQGDRMMMAHSVEGRFPFLDHRVMEFCAKTPSRIRLKALSEKYILKKAAKPFLPGQIVNRIKQGYRAPDSSSFFNGRHFAYIEELLSVENINDTGYFNPNMVSNLVKKCENTKGNLVGAKYNMAIVGIVTTLLLDKLFIKDFDSTVNSRIPSDTQFMALGLRQIKETKL